MEKASDTLAWLAERLVTPDEFEAGIRDRLLARKLSEAMFLGEVERYFAQHQLDYEQVHLYKISVPYEKLAREIFYQIEEEEISFYEAAHLYNIDEQYRLNCGYAGRINRWSLEPDIEAVVFAAKPKQVLGPFKCDGSHDLYMVEEFIPSRLTDELRHDIVQKLFGEWLSAELKRYAQ